MDAPKQLALYSTKWKRPETREAIRRYRATQAEQRAMPINEQWKLGAELRELKNRAYVEIEFEQLFGKG